MRTFIVTFFVLGAFLSLGKGIDPKEIKERFPNAPFVFIEREFEIEFKIDEASGALTAVMEEQTEVLQLLSSPSYIGNVMVPFDSWSEADIKSARFFEWDTAGNMRVKENVKVKHLKERDYFIDGFFYHDMKVKQFSPRYSVELPTMLKFKYEKEYSDTKFLTRIPVTYKNIPILEYKLKFVVPKSVKAKLVPFNTEGLEIEVEEELDDKDVVTTYSIRNFYYEDRSQYSSPDNFIVPHFLVLTESYEVKGETKRVLGNTSDLYDWYNSLIKELETDNPSTKELAQRIVAGASTDEEKIERIFDWVQDHLHYVAFEDGIAGFKPEEASAVILNRYGDCKGIANTLVQLYRSVGLDAQHAWIGTRSLNYGYDIPSLAVDNHMICALNHQGETIFLDGTDSEQDWKVPGAHIQGKEVLVANGDQFEIYRIPISDGHQNAVKIDLAISNIEKINQTVKGRISLSGNEAKKFRYYLKSLAEEDDLDAAGVIGGYYLQNYVPLKKVALDQSSIYTLDGAVTGLSFRNGQELELFIPPIRQLNIGPYEAVQFPVSVESTKHLEVTYTIDLPSGSKVVSLPNLNYASQDGELSYSRSASKQGATVVVKESILINVLDLAETQEQSWQGFTSAVIEAKNTPLKLVLAP